MRPGPEGPGCDVQWEDFGLMVDASMRPGPEGPGCVLANVVLPTPGTRFNEAGAGRPRMPGRQAPGSLTGRGFNEAGAGRPRMLGYGRVGL